MSGTSVDGIDAVLTEISGCGESISVKLIDFIHRPYPDDVRKRIFALFDKPVTAKELCQMNFLIGRLFAQAALEVINKAGFEKADLIGSHGQTIYHDCIGETGCEFGSTLQIGEGAVIAYECDAVTVSDFRVMDVAAGGQGAPLVPYTEYLLYRSKTQNIALQNIGGIGNITVLPKNCGAGDVRAFDTGPGNMVIDAVVTQITKGKLTYDKDGAMAARGAPCQKIIDEILSSRFFEMPPPKSAGREQFGFDFSAEFMKRCQSLSAEDSVATATALTAQSISLSLKRFVGSKVDKLIVGGGGSRNPVLMAMIAGALEDTEVITQECIGYDSQAKEAVAFAVLANEALFGRQAGMPSVTGASKPTVLGKINLVDN